MLKSNLYVYSCAYMLVKGNVTVGGQGPNVAAIEADRNNQQVIFKNCAPFTDGISKGNSAQVDITKDLDVVMPMYKYVQIVRIWP